MVSREELDGIISKSKNGVNVFLTHSGDRISLKEYKFINKFMEDGDVVAAVKEAGYTGKDGTEASYKKIGQRILSKPYIYEEMVYRLEEMNKSSIADASEIFGYFTRVMRGEEKDQFGLDAPLSERTAAARELAKRIIDIPNKATEADRAIKIELDWKRPDGNDTVQCNSPAEN